MVIKIPNVYELFKATELCSKEEHHRDAFFEVWLRHLKKREGLILTVFNKKKPQALLITSIKYDNDPLIYNTRSIWILTGTQEGKEKILKKVFKDDKELRALTYSNTKEENSNSLKELGFEIKSYNLELKGSVN